MEYREHPVAGSRYCYPNQARNASGFSAPFVVRAPRAHLVLAAAKLCGLSCARDFARAHGMRTYEPRQGRKAATVVCSASAVVTLAFFSLRIATYDRPFHPIP